MKRPVRLVDESEFKLPESIKTDRLFGVQRNVNNESWAGALVNAAEGEVFTSVIGSWIVPNAGPPPLSAYPDGIPDNQYAVNVFVANDMNEQAILPGVAIGTTSYCTVVGGKVVPGSQVAVAWYYQDAVQQSYPLNVNPGDLVTAVVCTPAPGQPSAGDASIGLFDNTEGTSYGMSYYTIDGTTPNGQTAGWFVSGYAVDQPDPIALANFATVFFDIILINTAGEVVNPLSSATLLNLSNSPAQVTTVGENPTVLLAYSYTGPSF